jgi:hypothetical protein
MENKIVIDGSTWRFRCPKCGACGECEGEDAIYNGNTAELKEYCICGECQTNFTVVSEMHYKHHTIDE